MSFASNFVCLGVLGMSRSRLIHVAQLLSWGFVTCCLARPPHMTCFIYLLHREDLTSIGRPPFFHVDRAPPDDASSWDFPSSTRR